MEVRGGTAVGKEAALHFGWAVVGFRVKVGCDVGACFDLFKFFRSGGVEKVADAFFRFAFVFGRG
jgi:hypothetical protein